MIGFRSDEVDADYYNLFLYLESLTAYGRKVDYVFDFFSINNVQSTSGRTMIVAILVPLLIFVAVVIFGLWARFYIRKILRKPQQNSGWVYRGLVIESVWNPFILWFIFLAAYAGIQISILSPVVKKLSGEVLGSLFVISLMWVAVALSGKMINYFANRTKGIQPLTSAANGIIRIIIIGIGVLIIFEIWGTPTLPLVIMISTGFIVIGIAFRSAFDNFLAGIEIAYGKHVEVGHFIKLASGEAGYVTQISWMRTIIKTSGGNLVIIPNSKLMANTIVNYGATDGENIIDVNQSALAVIEPANDGEALTDREREVLSLIGNGATNREIAEILIISEHTVKSHLRSILNKLHLRNRQQAAVYAEREGLIVKADTLKTNS